jgi:BirA family biotin operon repressor/biotin-[acetyl-CoA-carboxylase] ligase
MGQTLYYHPVIGSTNTQLKHLAEQGTPHGTLVLAEEQTAGRGRFERRWEAPTGSSLLMSILLRPDFLSPGQATWLTMISALAVVEAVESVTGLQAGLKWPNDVVFDGRKLAGLLTETGFNGSRLAWVVLGTGLNVNLSPAQLPAEMRSRVGSVQMFLQRPISRLEILQAYLSCLESRYLALENGYEPHQEWAARLTTLGQQITVKHSNGSPPIKGLAEAVREDGALLLRLPDGSLEPVLAGDVTLNGAALPQTELV